MNDKLILITGSDGKLGIDLKKKYPAANYRGSIDLDITNTEDINMFDWRGIKFIINGAAYTNVDKAETSDGRIAAWQVNAFGVSNLVNVCRKYDITLIHYSSDYVFDGSKTSHTEVEPFSPINTYGSSKAAGDIIVSSLSKHIIIRTSWLVGNGKNFVRTMLDLGTKGISPTVVNDQFGRLTFSSELVRATGHLINTKSYGTFNMSNSGDVVSWAEIAKAVFHENQIQSNVIEITSEENIRGGDFNARRPTYSGLDLTKIQNTGFISKDWRESLIDYVKKELSK